MNTYWSHSKKISVAIVDDDVSFLSVVKQFLDKISPNVYQITTIDSPDEAFFTITSSPTFDVIISDFEMPKLNGLDLFTNLHESGIDIPFILFTGSRNEDLPSKALNAGVKFFLYKDSNVIAVLKQLDQLIKITVAEIDAEKELIEHENMLSDFIHLLTTSNDFQEHTIYSQELIKNILESFISISDSEYVFLTEIVVDEYSEEILSADFFTSVKWNQNDGFTFKFMKKDDFLFKNLSQYYSDVLVEKKPVIENNLELTAIDNVDKLVPINSFLALPIFFEPSKKLVGIIGLVNKPGGYDDQIIFKLNPFCLNLSNFMYLNMYIKDLKKKMSFVEK